MEFPKREAITSCSFVFQMKPNNLKYPARYVVRTLPNSMTCEQFTDILASWNYTCPKDYTLTYYVQGNQLYHFAPNCVVALFPILAAIWYCRTRRLPIASLKAGRNMVLRISEVVVRMCLELDANCIFPAPNQDIPGPIKIRNGNRLETSQSYRSFLKMEEVGLLL